jgi:hypothetical protein
VHVQLQSAWFAERYPRSSWSAVEGGESGDLLREMRERTDVALVVGRADLVANVAVADVEGSRRQLNTCARFGTWS